MTIEQVFEYNMCMKAIYQSKILKFYRDHKRMPTITEVMALFKFKSRSSAFYVTQQLVKDGLLQKDGLGKLVPTGKIHELKLVGRIRAGFASPAEDELADTITVGEYLIRDKDASYLLQVEGDSMMDAGIIEGDMVIFEKSSDYKPGDIVVALIEDGYTIKYLRKKDSKFYLEAANENYPTIHPKEGQIIGLVTGTFRKYKK
ncbi:TPA: LexA family transcriptional repressor [Candidatus Taylorbacteria bacterium]|nr:LexA family transcriptional repressor [Candidatus Taylorbacteria bacterium]